MQTNFKVIFHGTSSHGSFHIGSSYKNDFYIAYDYIIIYI